MYKEETQDRTIDEEQRKRRMRDSEEDRVKVGSSGDGKVSLNTYVFRMTGGSKLA